MAFDQKIKKNNPRAGGDFQGKRMAVLARPAFPFMEPPQSVSLKLRSGFERSFPARQQIAIGGESLVGAGCQGEEILVNDPWARRSGRAGEHVSSLT